MVNRRPLTEIDDEIAENNRRAAALQREREESTRAAILGMTAEEIQRLHEGDAFDKGDVARLFHIRREDIPVTDEAQTEDESAEDETKRPIDKAWNAVKGIFWR